ncbi:uncharacterized protein LOC106713025 isoform X2 [Papilio machaon]|uniref:uncharacterized protein LOC106713025 isoform X2 n=2 Tax=Papilio machaon TaxID=76193 RepID=UPI001E664C94|nr:uncharacterized protein LOC106713025 isoform X2 [Papilio machaon]
MRPKITMSACGDIRQFEGEKWEVFRQQLECFILVNDITEDKKVPLLITKLSPKVFETLTYLCSPLQPLELKFEELCTKLKEKYAKPLSTTLERAEFRKRNQLPNEKIQEYVLELKKLAAKCQFKDADDQVKEKFMDGVSSKLIKFELMKSQVEMSLEKCIEIGRTVEAALLHANGSSESTENIFFYQQRIRNTGTRPKHKQNNNSKQHSIKCFCCGKENHVKADCRLIKKFCSECGQQGHIYKMCSKKRQISTLEAKQPEEDAEEPEENVIQNSFQEEYKTYSMHNN